MKKTLLLMIATFTLASIIPTFAQEAGPSEKDQCLLYSKGCKHTVDSIQKKMKRLENEIKKGKKVYTPAELKILQEKLDETNQVLDDLLKGGSK